MGKSLLSVLVVVLLSGCSSSYLLEKPHVIQSCYQNKDSNMLDYSSAALLNSLLERRWTITGVDAGNRVVTAKACRVRFCASFDFTVRQNGNVEMLRKSEMRSKYDGIVERWVANLDKSFANKCFNSFDGLVVDLQNDGFDYKSVMSGRFSGRDGKPGAVAD